MSTFAERLKELRNNKDLTQDELAKAIKISKSSINMYERGEREPKFETLEAIADFFNVDMDYLLGRSDEPNHMLSIVQDAVKSGHIASDTLKNISSLLKAIENLSPEDIHNIEVQEVGGHNENMLEKVNFLIECLAAIQSLDPIKRKDLLRYIRFLSTDKDN